MRISTVLLPLLALIALSVGEKFEKIEGTSGEFSDIAVDSEGRWYIVKDKALYYSLDKGVTCTKLDLPSKQFVHTGLGVDGFDNLYVQDYDLTLFVVAPSINGTFVFEEIRLYKKSNDWYGSEEEAETSEKERLVSRPFSLFENTVFLATKTGLKKLENGETTCRGINISYYSKLYPTQFLRSNTSSRFGSEYETTFYSAGNERHWIYQREDTTLIPVRQTMSFVKRMHVVGKLIYYIVNEEKKVRVTISVKRTMVPIMFREKGFVKMLEINSSSINDGSDFVVFSPKHDYKTYIYGNVDGTGTLYELGERKIDENYVPEVVATHGLEGVRFNCGVLTIDDNRIYFGTSDGVYELTDIQPKRVVN